MSLDLDSNLQSAFTAVGLAVKGRISASEKGANNGVATLDSNGKVPAVQLPSFILETTDIIGLDSALSGKASVSHTHAISYITGLQTELDSKTTMTDVNIAINNIVGAAPEALNTLAKIANQLANDESAVSALTTAVSNKVDKVVGKGLSTEDYTTVEKTKLATLENYTLPIATDLVAGGVRVGSGLSITNGLLSVNSSGVADSVEWTGVNNTPTTLIGYGITDAATSGHIHTDVSTTVSGFMSASDKVKLNSLSNYNKPSAEPISYITGLQTELDAKAATTDIGVADTDYVAVFSASLL